MGRSDLPQEMVEDILSRLPAKSLKRFSCVNKSWSTLFQDPCFIAKHQHLSQKNWSIFAYGVDCEADKPVVFLHPNLDDDAADDDFDSRGIILESPFLEEPKQSEEIVGSCINGIICLKYCVEHNNIHDFALWNPAFRELKVLPSLPIHFPSNVDYEDVGSAFGYDSNSNDFKVITILSYWNDPGYTVPWDPSVIMHTHVEVYTLSINSWRQVDCDTVSHINFPAPFGEIYLNGVYHWCGTAPGIAKDYDVIVSFDMRNEVFGILSTPNLSDILDPAYVWEALAVLGNCVALVVFDSRPTDKIFHIWVMREYGIKESWTKQYVIGPFSGITNIVGFELQILLLGDKILMVEDNGQVVVYNLSAQKIKNLRVGGLPSLFRASQIMVYEESLVSIMG
ncbi:F-box protein CPR1-like [Castanea sativa]|uniref:F-box protein CPR1-like n=1 Tax=Castanea sativa TaxID=21020 RepID=UPI003F654295